MPSKFRLSTRRKYSWRKNQSACHVSVEHVTIPTEKLSILPTAVCPDTDDSAMPDPPSELIVSIQRTTLLNPEASSLTSLQQRFKRMANLPQGIFYHKLIISCV